MDNKKVSALKQIIQRLHRGETAEEVKQNFVETFGDTSADDLAAAERQLISDGMPVSEIQRLCDVHASVFEGNIEDIHQPHRVDRIPGHPAFVFRGENKGIKSFLDEKIAPTRKKFADDPGPAEREALAEAVRELGKLDRHYKRKENLLFPYLEKAGVTAPPKVMWGVDDEIRELWKNLLQKLDEKRTDDRKSVLRDLDELVKKVRGMISKEELILMPLLMKKLDAEAWLTAAAESPEIGYCFNSGIEGASPSDAAAWLQAQKKQKTSYAVDAGSDAPDEAAEGGQSEITLPSGHFTKEELTGIFNAMPADVTFIGADNKVRYYSEGKRRVFPRTRTIIGRDVGNCHPPKSLPVVNKLIKDLREGKKDSESFWIQRGGAFILIRYIAVRSSEGTYLGVLEVTEEVTGIRNLSGEKTLMS